MADDEHTSDDESSGTDADLELGPEPAVDEPHAADELLTVTVPDPEPVPTVAAAVATPSPAPRTGWLSALLLVILVVLAGLLAIEFIHADTGTIADEGWRNNALWAAGLAVVLLGLAFASLALTTASSGSNDSTVARASVVAAALGVVVALVVVALADEQGGQLARSSAPTTVATATEATDGSVPDAPIGIAEALNPELLSTAALPVDVRTFVSVDLTEPGRRFVAGAMGCRPSDFVGNRVNATAIGGTWAQPLLVMGSPVTEDGRIINRCRQTVLRLPLEAGIVGSGL